MKFGKKCGNMCLLFFRVEKNLKVATLVGTAGDGVLVTAAAIPFCVTERQKKQQTEDHNYGDGPAVPSCRKDYWDFPIPEFKPTWALLSNCCLFFFGRKYKKLKSK
jgi:hypothetical protein